MLKFHFIGIMDVLKKSVFCGFAPSTTYMGVLVYVCRCEGERQCRTTAVTGAHWPSFFTGTLKSHGDHQPSVGTASPWWYPASAASLTAVTFPRLGGKRAGGSRSSGFRLRPQRRALILMLYPVGAWPT